MEDTLANSTVLYDIDDNFGCTMTAGNHGSELYCVLRYQILDLEDDVLSVLDSVLDPSGSSKHHTEKITL